MQPYTVIANGPVTLLCLRREYILQGSPSSGLLHEAQRLAKRTSVAVTSLVAAEARRDSVQQLQQLHSTATAAAAVSSSGGRAVSPATGAAPHRVATAALELADNEEFVRSVAQRVLRKVRRRGVRLPDTAASSSKQLRLSVELVHCKSVLQRRGTRCCCIGCRVDLC